MKMNFFSKKTMIFTISDLFFVYKMKIPQKWQMPLIAVIKLMLTLQAVKQLILT